MRVRFSSRGVERALTLGRASARLDTFYGCDSTGKEENSYKLRISQGIPSAGKKALLGI